MRNVKIRRRVITVAWATALGGAALIALPAQVAGASVSGPSPITYQSSIVPLQNLGTVNLSSIAASESPPPTGGSSNGTILDGGAESSVGPGTGKGPSLINGAIGNGVSTGWHTDHGNGLQGFEGISGSWAGRRQWRR